jgi:RNA polymerase sigma-B factor
MDTLIDNANLGSRSGLSEKVAARDKTESADAIDRRLIRHYRKTKDPKAREIIVRRHERLVWSLAWRYRSAGEPVEDLAQEGFLGLLKAIERYDCQNLAKFSSYAAMKITGNIEHYLRDRSGTIRQPGWVQEIYLRIRRESQRLATLNGRQPTHAEIAEAIGESEERIARILEVIETRRIASLDEPIPGREATGGSLGEFIADPSSDSLANRLDNKADLERAMERLDETQKTAVNLCFFEDLTFEEAGGRMGMDRHRARRVVVRAIQILKQQLQTA